MRTFIYKLSLFLGGLLLLILIGIFLPPTRKSRESFLFSKIDKDALLQHTPSPRLVIIGGSNTSFSIDSQMLKDSLQLNPVNTGISGALGLIYMLDNSIEKILPGDIVLVCPEYSQFFGDAAYGEDYLIRVIMDISPIEVFSLQGKQLSMQLAHLPRYAFTKFKFSEYFNDEEDFIKKTVYQRSAYNEYGDVSRHWTLKPINVPPYGELRSRFNQKVIEKLVAFQYQLKKKRATLYITFPAFQSDSFENQRSQILQIENALNSEGFKLLGSPERYKMQNDLIFDTPYHLIKRGVTKRTQLLIDDLKEVYIPLDVYPRAHTDLVDTHD